MCTGRVSHSVQRLSQGARAWQTDRQTDNAVTVDTETQARAQHTCRSWCARRDGETVGLGRCRTPQTQQRREWTDRYDAAPGSASQSRRLQQTQTTKYIAAASVSYTIKLLGMSFIAHWPAYDWARTLRWVCRPRTLRWVFRPTVSYSLHDVVHCRPPMYVLLPSIICRSDLHPLPPSYINTSDCFACLGLV